jgi:hypothetical protein
VTLAPRGGRLRQTLTEHSAVVMMTSCGFHGDHPHTRGHAPNAEPAGRCRNGLQGGTSRCHRGFCGPNRRPSRSVRSNCGTNRLTRTGSARTAGRRHSRSSLSAQIGSTPIRHDRDFIPAIRPLPSGALGHHRALGFSRHPVPDRADSPCDVDHVPQGMSAEDSSSRW